LIAKTMGAATQSPGTITASEIHPTRSDVVWSLGDAFISSAQPNFTYFVAAWKAGDERAGTRNKTCAPWLRFAVEAASQRAPRCQPE
jgi:hypothetical protein